MKKLGLILVLAIGGMMSAPAHGQNQATAVFAGGCFWCIESAFEKVDGVTAAVSGYIDGKEKNPTYKEVSSGATGHTEAVQVIYDPGKVSYGALLDIFWRNIDPTQVNGQFADRGSQYRTAIFYQDDAQKKAAEESKDKLQKSGKFKQPIAVEIKAATTFYPAEEYHQDYYKKNPGHYKSYHFFSGRGPYIKKVWGTE